MRLTLASSILILILLGSQLAQARCFGVPAEDGEAVIPWYVHLDIIASGGHLGEVEFGVGPGLSDGFEQGVDEYWRLNPEEPLHAYFLYPDAGGPFSRLSKSFTSFRSTASWLLLIAYSGERAEIRIRWDAKQTSSIPEDIALRLSTSPNDEVDMKTSEDVVFQAIAGTYMLRITASELQEQGYDLLLVLFLYGVAAVTLFLFMRRRRR
ncbi:MAG: hypothetical protein ACE5HJ_06385 [Thermoplasmata archaeon]